MKQDGAVTTTNIKIGPVLYVTLIFLTSALAFPGIYDLFFEPNETSGFLFIFSIPAIFVFSLLSLLVRPQYQQWQDRGKAWAFLLGNALVVWVAGLCFTYVGLMLT